MYYKSVSKKSDREMFEFLRDHFQYATLNPWNGCYSVANNVKVYNLNLTGDCYKVLEVIYDFTSEYCGIMNMIIYDWEFKHEGYKVGFNGRSDGYLVLYNDQGFGNILPDFIDDITYEDFKQSLHDNGEYVKDYHNELKKATRLVQDFDQLCDELRDYLDDLSKELEKTSEER